MARNRAIEASRGEFVTGLEDDDVFDPGRLSAFVRAWSERERTGAVPVLLYGDATDLGSEPGAVGDPGPDASALDLCRANRVGNQVFAPRDTWRAAGGFDEELGGWQDLDLWLRMLGPDGRAGHVPAARQWIDRDDGRARISSRSREKVAATRDQVVARHASLGARAQFLIFCQMFTPYYGFEPTWTEVRAAISLDPGLRSASRILALKRRRRRSAARARKA